MSASEASTRTPADIARLLVETINSHQWSDLVDLYTEDAVVESPFATEADRVTVGREQLHHRITRASALGIVLKPLNVEILTDGSQGSAGWAVVQFDYDAHTPADERFSGSCIRVLKLREGKIAHMRVYHLHTAFTNCNTSVAPTEPRLTRFLATLAGRYDHRLRTPIVRGPG